MAGFEVIVRPVVFPAIRPAPAQPVPPADDPDKGFATIHGNGGHQFSTSSSYSVTASSSQRTETQRRVDEVRVYQKEASGKVNKENFVDVDMANKVWMKGPPTLPVDNRPSFSLPPPAPSSQDWKSGKNERGVYYYQGAAPYEMKDNIEVRKRNVFVTNSSGQTIPRE